MKKFLQIPFVFWTTLCVVVLLAIGEASYLGYTLGTKFPQTVLVKGVTNLETDPTVTADFGVFWQAWKLMKDEFLKGADLKGRDLMYGAIDGLVQSGGDPNTNFFPPDDIKKFEEDVAGKFGGIGAEIGIRNDQLVVIAPLKESPAERAGLKALDKIIKIGDKVAVDMKVNDAVKLIRGPVGTKITLNILRNGWDKPKDFTITREEIKIPTLDYKMLDRNVGYIGLHSFNEQASRLFFEASKDLLGQGLNGLILDLRDNPGGFLEVAVEIAGWFVDKGGVVAIEEFRSQDKKTFRANGNAIFKQIPVVVLVNEGSASASEILAGALRDSLGVKLVGQKTFGKGTVQELKYLKDSSSIKLTIAHWLLPKGDLIDKNGIKPDFEVKISDDDIKAKKDPQLDKAKSLMEELINKAVANKSN